jgi:hypothetical protein
MSAIGTPSRQAILSLYHNMLRTSQSFSSYNFREYFVSRTKDTFRTIQVSTIEYFYIYFRRPGFVFTFPPQIHTPRPLIDIPTSF